MTNKDQSTNPPSSDDVAEDLLKAKKLRKARRFICDKHVANLTNRVMSNDRDTDTLKAIIIRLEDQMTELEKYDVILQVQMDDDDILPDMEECTNKYIAINTAISKAQRYIDSITSSTNINSEVKTSEINKNTTSKSVHSKGVDAKPQFPNVIKHTSTLHTTEDNTLNSIYPSSVKSNLLKKEHPPQDCSINIISDKKQFHINSYCCEICLTRDHQESQCVDVVSCEICNKQHHINCCPVQVSKMNGNNNLHNKTSHNNNREIKTLNIQQGSETDVDTLQKDSSTEKTTALALTDPLQEVKAYLPMRTITDFSSQTYSIDKSVVTTLGPVSCDSINAPNSITKKDNLHKMEVAPFNTIFDNLKLSPDNVRGYFSMVVRLPGLTDTTTSINTTALRLVINALNGINKQSFDNLKMFSAIVRKYFSIVVHSSGLVETTLLDVIVLHLTSNVSIIDV